MKKNVFPAIDLIDGKCVRLLQGVYSSETQYSDDPISQALSFQEEGASWIHIVDLDAARTGIANNASIIEKIAMHKKILRFNNFYDPANLDLVHHVNQSLKANFLF